MFMFNTYEINNYIDDALLKTNTYYYNIINKQMLTDLIHAIKLLCTLVKKYDKNLYKLFAKNTTNHAYSNFLTWWYKNFKMSAPGELGFNIGMREYCNHVFLKN